ncbi:uncharacterized protein LOC107365976 isoform X2 [Tetranychus urticae]|uniref:uncharacterized protein LOC107365976 isoform X2 n=1 Tax=Tetranychus urticae TaxID=32264 RepID=UPI000D6469D3|nr:uncharacterized protein LOC107365976 isoform X2 [Tetranychus urticae]
MTVKLIFLLIVLLSIESFAIDFTTIGQKEIVEYIKNRADVLYGAKLSERNLQDLLSSAVFTGLEEEALTFAYGKSVGSEVIPDVEVNPKDLLTGLTALVSESTTESVPLKIFLTSDSQGTTDIQMGTLTTTKSSSSKQSVGDFVVTSVQSQNNDKTNLDGSITINLGGSTDSHNLTLFKTVYISAEIKITSLGSEWDENLLKNDGKLISLLPSTTGSLYTVEYQSLIRESIPSNDGALFAGTKTSGTVLVHKNPNGVLSLSGRIISGKIEPTSEDQAEELVDSFLTLNGAKSRQFFIKDDEMVSKKSNSIVEPNIKKSDIKSKSNLISGGSALFDYLGYLYRGHKSHHKENSRSQSNHGYRRNHDSRRWHENQREDPYSWQSDAWSNQPGWRYDYHYNYDYRYEWHWRNFDEPSKQPVRSTTQAPSPSTQKPKPEPVVVSTTSKPSTSPSTPTPLVITTRQPEKVTTQTPEPEKLTIAPTTETPVEQEQVTTTSKPIFSELTEPELPPLPKGTTVSVWSTKIIQ